jgi:hypothetical protein
MAYKILAIKAALMMRSVMGVCKQITLISPCHKVGAGGRVWADVLDYRGSNV